MTAVFVSSWIRMNSNLQEVAVFKVLVIEVTRSLDHSLNRHHMSPLSHMSQYCTGSPLQTSHSSLELPVLPYEIAIWVCQLHLISRYGLGSLLGFSAVQLWRKLLSRRVQLTCTIWRMFRFWQVLTRRFTWAIYVIDGDHHHWWAPLLVLVLGQLRIRQYGKFRSSLAGCVPALRKQLAVATTAYFCERYVAVAVIANGGYTGGTVQGGV